MNARAAYVGIAALASALFACGPDSDSAGRLSREELLKPETCKDCHPRHYEQWSASMHAYASQDPVFRAMNARGQREQPELGKFCVNCHAPMAVHEGQTKDGTNLDDLPEHLQGVTCYFCHNVASVAGDHDNMLKLSDDVTMRGGIADPVDPKAHDAAYSQLHDGQQLESSPMCGGCHDIVTKNGVHLERTFEEWGKSFLSDPSYAETTGATPGTCASCHMRTQAGTTIAVGNHVNGLRTFHDHLFPAVDVALTKFPHRDALKSAIEDCELPQSIGFFDFGLDPVSNSPGAFTVTLETSAGHSQPSGASHDRRVWLEIAAYDHAGTKVFETDAFKDDAADKTAGGNAPHIFHDSIYGKDGKPVHMFWDAAPSDEHREGYVSRALPYGAKTATATPPPHSLSVSFALTQEQDAAAERFELKLRMRPIGLDVLQDLVDSGDLDAGVLDEVPTFTVYSSTIERVGGGGSTKFEDPTIPLYDCDRYRCLIEPMSSDCPED